LKIKYEIEVKAQCPVNFADTDLYAFTIESETMIEVERITEFFEMHSGDRNIFQEKLTQKAATTLGAIVTSVGYHSGVKVTCVAP
jgi:hypothetical protein